MESSASSPDVCFLDCLQRICYTLSVPVSLLRVRMMAKELKRVRLEPDTDLRHIIEDVHTDKAPRLIERGGSLSLL